MPALTRDDLLRKREELLKDIEALDRVLRLFGATPNGLKPQPTPESFAMTPPPRFESSPTDQPIPARMSLKELVIEGLKLQAESGAAPRELLNYCKGKDYFFTSDINGAASISTALSRLVTDGTVRKQDGRYYWEG